MGRQNEMVIIDNPGYGYYGNAGIREEIFINNNGYGNDVVVVEQRSNSY